MAGLSLKDKLAKDKEQAAARGAKSQKEYKFKPGKTTIRILPGKTNPDEFEHPVGKHWVKDPGSREVLAVAADLSIISGGTETCPVREMIQKAWNNAKRQGIKELEDHWKDCLGYSRRAMNISVFDGDSSVTPQQPQLWEASEQLYDNVVSILQEFIEANPETSPFDLSEKGLTLVIERTGSGKNDTKYAVRPAMKGRAIPQEAIDAMVDLKAYAYADATPERQTRALEALQQITGLAVSPKAAGALTGGGGLSLPAPAEKPVGAPAPSTTTTPANAEPSIDDILAGIDA